MPPVSKIIPLPQLAPPAQRPPPTSATTAGNRLAGAAERSRAKSSRTIAYAEGREVSRAATRIALLEAQLRPDCRGELPAGCRRMGLQVVAARAAPAGERGR